MKYILKIKIYGNSYEQGELGDYTKVYFSSDNEKWNYLGKFKISGKDRWEIYTFEINLEKEIPDKFYIKIDDNKNFKDNNFGKTISWIKLFKA